MTRIYIFLLSCIGIPLAIIAGITDYLSQVIDGLIEKSSREGAKK